MTSAAVVVAAYLIGSVPVAYIAGRLTKGVDIRDYGSGNVGASNIWQSVSRALVVPVGLAQIGQGVAAVGIAKLSGVDDGVQVAAGLAAVAANNWSPWLGFSGGRGIGQTIGVLGWFSLPALAAFIVVALAGVVLRSVPQGVALGVVVSPFVAAATGADATFVAGCALLAMLMLAKRLLANGAPDPEYARPAVWLHRLAFDRDTPDREAWVRRNVASPPAPSPTSGEGIVPEQR